MLLIAKTWRRRRGPHRPAEFWNRTGTHAGPMGCQKSHRESRQGSPGLRSRLRETQERWVEVRFPPLTRQMLSMYEGVRESLRGK